jgi:phosphoribosylformylglycinamidine synthase PurS subunit
VIAKVVVMPKAVVNDPQGVTVKQGLRSLGFDEVDEVRVGKYIEIRLETDSEAEAVEHVEQMCRKLLANHVIEDFRYTIDARGNTRGRHEARGSQASPTDPLPQSGAGDRGRDSLGAGDPPLSSDASSANRVGKAGSGAA